MITNAQHPAPRDAYRLDESVVLHEPASLDRFEHGYDGSDSEILRMIEMSGMISLDCSVLQDA